LDIIIRRPIAQRFGYKAFVPYSVSEKSWESWRDEQVINLGELSTRKLDDLEALFESKKGVRGVGVLLRDVQAWRKVLESGASKMRARTVRQFETLLQQYLLPIEGHRVYKRHTEGAMLCFYVSEIEYHPPVAESSHRSRSPAQVTMSLAYEEVGGQTSTSVTFYADDVRGVSVARALAEKGYLPETEELRAEYLKTTERYVRVAGQIGKQFWVCGPSRSQERYAHSTVMLNNEDGESGRAVIDVFREEGERQERDHRTHLSPYYWPRIAAKSKYDPETDEDLSDDVDNLADEEKAGDLEVADIEVPIHPWLIVFHLAKHLRLRAHVDQLEEYIYDESLSDKLVLPPEQKMLVQLLIETKGGMFQDIVKGKGGGAVVLLTGMPGVGKTLTAEVYAESEQRALYSVQCSQLGTDPDHLEAELMNVFTRAKRWNAVMLLDEADVYVHERGNNMQQNAIVGVFLRVLEYQGTVLFLTTNRPEDVDDAIASRCIARLVYESPCVEDAAKIWRILANVSDLKISDKVIANVTAANPGMTGRDIKNSLKLASLMPDAEKGITAKQVEYVQQFKPTGKVASRSSASG